MADSKAAPKRVGDYNPDIETGDTLDAIADTDVEIASVAIDPGRKGKSGDYDLAVITLTDGKVYHTGSPIVVERLSRIPADGFPVMARFRKEKSQNDPTRSYWTVS